MLLLTTPHTTWLPSRSSLAEATVGGFGLTVLHASGCLRLDRGVARPCEISHRKVIRTAGLMARSAVRRATQPQIAGGSANSRLSPSVLLIFL